MVARRGLAHWAVAAVLGCAQAACDGTDATSEPLGFSGPLGSSGPQGSATNGSLATGAPANTAKQSAGTSGPESGALALGSSGAATPAATSPFTGTWRASFEATRGDVSVARDHPWPAWKKDAGTRLGKGTLELVVEADGSVRGAIGGALGELDVRGRVEDGTLRAGVTPKDPDEPDAMRGSLLGTATGDAGSSAKRLGATLRAASGDGLVVRAAKLDLAKN